MGTIYETDLLLKTHGGSMHPGGLRLTDRAVRLAGLTEGMQAADIGCGTGVTAAFLRDKYKLNVTGLERSEKLLRIGLNVRPDVNLIRWDGQILPFEEDCLDAAFFECTLSVMENAAQILASCAKALKHNGVVIISDVYLKRSLNDGGIPLTIEELTGALTGAGFGMTIREDHTPALRTYMAELWEKNGDGMDACSFFGTSCKLENIRMAELGYMLTIARKI